VISTNSLQFQNAAGTPLCTGSGGSFQAGATYGFVADAPSCLPASRLTVADLKAEGVAGLTNANVLLSAAFIYLGNNQSCTSVFYVTGVRIQ
jgi:hypothetical protein